MIPSALPARTETIDGCGRNRLKPIRAHWLRYSVRSLARKDIRLSDAAYRRLAAAKRPGESFTDVVLRLTSRPSLQELAAVATAEEAEALADAVERDVRLRRRTRRVDP